MSYSRNTQPQLLSIQAIIQKSQYKSKILNNIPVDIKKLFMQQIVKNNQKSLQLKRIPFTYQNIHTKTIQNAQTYYNNYGNNNRVTNSNSKKTKIVAPLPTSKPKQVKSQSLNTSKNGNKNIQKLQTLKTTRTNSYSRQKKREKSNRNSFNSQQINLQKHKKQMDQFNKQQYQQNQNCNPNISHNAQNNLENIVKTTKKRKFFNTFQYELVLPDKNNKDRGFAKIKSKKQIQFQQEIELNTLQNNSQQLQQLINVVTQQNMQTIEQQKLQQKYQNQNLKPSTKDINSKNTIQSQKSLSVTQTPIPDFVLVALTKQTKKISTIKNIQSAQYFQFGISQQKTKKDQKMRLLKPPPNVLNMKKKISYNRIRRSQQSSQLQQLIQPKVNFIKLIQKQRQKQREKQRQKQKQRLQNLLRKNSQILSREKRIRSKERMQTVDKLRTYKNNAEEEVKGWDVLDGPQYFEQY